MVKFGRAENLLDMVTQYEILGFYRLGLNRLKYFRPKLVISYDPASRLVLFLTCEHLATILIFVIIKICYAYLKELKPFDSICI